MKTILSGLTAVSMLAVGAPAAAQYSNNGYGNSNAAGANGNIAARIEQLRTRIQAGVQSGAISRAEAQPLREQLRELSRLERQYSANGLSGQERADLQQRLRNLRQQLRAADGGQGRYGDDRYADDRYDNGRYENGRYEDGRYGQNGQDYDRDDDGYDDRDSDRDGRYEGEYEQPTQRGGLGGIIDGLLGRGASGGLRVGQRAPGNLGGVPYEYRNRYRDGNDVYYRADSQRIYEIDTRSQTVRRVFAMNR